jgi:hypothetical protein
MEDRRPPDFDWVTARHDCSIAAVFAALLHYAERDIKTFTALRPGARSPRFEKEDGDTAFSVIRVASPFGGSMSRATFVRYDDHIEVESTGFPLRRLTMTLDDSGDCRVQVNGEGPQLDKWQVLRLILEPILFPAAPDPARRH